MRALPPGLGGAVRSLAGRVARHDEVVAAAGRWRERRARGAARRAGARGVRVERAHGPFVNRVVGVGAGARGIPREGELPGACLAHGQRRPGQSALAGNSPRGVGVDDPGGRSVGGGEYRRVDRVVIDIGERRGEVLARRGADERREEGVLLGIGAGPAEDAAHRVHPAGVEGKEEAAGEPVDVLAGVVEPDPVHDVGVERAEVGPAGQPVLIGLKEPRGVLVVDLLQRGPRRVADRVHDRVAERAAHGGEAHDGRDPFRVVEDAQRVGEGGRSPGEVVAELVVEDEPLRAARGDERDQEAVLPGVPLDVPAEANGIPRDAADPALLRHAEVHLEDLPAAVERPAADQLRFDRVRVLVDRGDLVLLDERVDVLTLDEPRVVQGGLRPGAFLEAHAVIGREDARDAGIRRLAAVDRGVDPGPDLGGGFRAKSGRETVGGDGDQGGVVRGERRRSSDRIAGAVADLQRIGRRRALGQMDIAGKEIPARVRVAGRRGLRRAARFGGARDLDGRHLGAARATYRGDRDRVAAVRRVPVRRREPAGGSGPVAQSQTIPHTGPVLLTKPLIEAQPHSHVRGAPSASVMSSPRAGAADRAASARTSRSVRARHPRGTHRGVILVSWRRPRRPGLARFQKPVDAAVVPYIYTAGAERYKGQTAQDETAQPATGWRSGSSPPPSSGCINAPASNESAPCPEESSMTTRRPIVTPLIVSLSLLGSVAAARRGVPRAAILGDALARDRAVPGRTGDRGNRRPRAAERLSPRQRFGRRVEDRRCRRDLDAAHRQDADRGGGRARGRPLGSERDLRRHRRGVHPRQHDQRQRRLEIHRRRPHLDEPRPRRHAADRKRDRGSGEPRRGLRRGARTRVRPQRRARRVPLARRREDLGEGPLQGRRDRRGRGDLRPEQPARAVRRALAGAPPALVLLERRPGERPLPLGRRRDDLEAARGARPSRAASSGGSGGDPEGRLEPRVRDGRGGGRRALSLRRRRRDVAARQRRRADPAALLVLQPHLGRSRERRHALLRQHRPVPLGGRRQDPDAPPRAPRRPPRPVDRSGRPAPNDQRPRRRRLGEPRRRADLVHRAEPADRAVLPRDRGRPVPLPRLRRAAGQLDDRDRQPLGPGGDHGARLVRGRRRRERLHRARPSRPERRLRRHRVERGHALRQADRAVAGPRAVAARHLGARRRGASAPLQLDLPRDRVEARSSFALRRRGGRLPQRRRGHDLADREPGSHPQRQEQAEAVGRADPARYHVRRVLRHDLRARRVSDHRRRAVGGDRRRADPPDARRREDVDRGHAEGPPRVEHGQPDRSLAVRRRGGVRRRGPAQARRRRAVRLQDGGLRQDLDAGRRRDPRGRLRPRRPGGSEAQGAALRGHGDRRVRLVRRRRAMAAAAAQSPSHAGPRPRGARRRPRRRDPRPVVLDPRRSRAAAAARHEGRPGGRLALPAADGPARHGPGVGGPPATGRREPTAGRDPRLLPEDASEGRGDDRDPRRRGARVAQAVEHAPVRRRAAAGVARPGEAGGRPVEARRAQPLRVGPPRGVAGAGPGGVLRGAPAEGTARAAGGLHRAAHGRRKELRRAAADRPRPPREGSAGRVPEAIRARDEAARQDQRASRGDQPSARGPGAARRGRGTSGRGQQERGAGGARRRSLEVARRRRGDAAPGEVQELGGDAPLPHDAQRAARRAALRGRVGGRRPRRAGLPGLRRAVVAARRAAREPRAHPRHGPAGVQRGGSCGRRAGRDPALTGESAAGCSAGIPEPRFSPAARRSILWETEPPHSDRGSRSDDQVPSLVHPPRALLAARAARPPAVPAHLAISPPLPGPGHGGGRGLRFPARDPLASRDRPPQAAAALTSGLARGGPRIAPGLRLPSMPGDEALHVAGVELAARERPLHLRELQDRAEDRGHRAVAPERLVVEDQLLELSALDRHADDPVGRVDGGDHALAPRDHPDPLARADGGADAAAETDLPVERRFLGARPGGPARRLERHRLHRARVHAPPAAGAVRDRHLGQVVRRVHGVQAAEPLGCEHRLAAAAAAIADEVHTALHVLPELHQVSLTGPREDVEPLRRVRRPRVPVADQRSRGGVERHADVHRRAARAAEVLHLVPAVAQADADVRGRANHPRGPLVVEHVQRDVAGEDRLRHEHAPELGLAVREERLDEVLLLVEVPVEQLREDLLVHVAADPHHRELEEAGHRRREDVLRLPALLDVEEDRPVGEPVERLLRLGQGELPRAARRLRGERPDRKQRDQLGLALREQHREDPVEQL